MASFKLSKFANDCILKRMLSGAPWISSAGFRTKGSYRFSFSDAPFCSEGPPGYAYLSIYMCVLVSQSCPVLCDPVNCSLGFSVHGIFQASILEWVAIPFSRGSFWPRDWIWVSCAAGRFFIFWVTREAYIYPYIYIYMCIYICIYMYVCIYIYAYTYVYIYTHVYIPSYIHIYIYIYIKYTHTYIIPYYTHTHTHTHIYIYMHTGRSYLWQNTDVGSNCLLLHSSLNPNLEFLNGKLTD